MRPEELFSFAFLSNADYTMPRTSTAGIAAELQQTENSVASTECQSG